MFHFEACRASSVPRLAVGSVRWILKMIGDDDDIYSDNACALSIGVTGVTTGVPEFPLLHVPAAVALPLILFRAIPSDRSDWWSRRGPDRLCRRRVVLNIPK